MSYEAEFDDEIVFNEELEDRSDNKFNEMEDDQNGRSKRKKTN